MKNRPSLDSRRPVYQGKLDTTSRDIGGAPLADVPCRLRKPTERLHTANVLQGMPGLLRSFRMVELVQLRGILPGAEGVLGVIARRTRNNDENPSL